MSLDFYFLFFCDDAYYAYAYAYDDDDVSYINNHSIFIYLDYGFFQYYFQ